MTTKRLAMPKTTDARISVLEAKMDAQSEILHGVEQNLVKIAEVISTLASIRQSVERATELAEQNHDDINGMGQRVDSVLSKATVNETRINHVVRVLIYIGSSIGLGIASAIFYAAKVFVDHALTVIG